MLTPQISPPAENSGTFNTFVSLHFIISVFVNELDKINTTLMCFKEPESISLA